MITLLVYCIAKVFLAHKGFIIGSTTLYILAMLFTKAGKKLLTICFCGLLLLFLITHLGTAYTVLENSLSAIETTSERVSDDLIEKFEKEMETQEGDFADRFQKSVRALFTGNWTYEGAEAEAMPKQEFFLWREFKALFGYA